MCWGIPAKVLEVEGIEAVVDLGGVRRRVLLLVEGVSTGDYVLVHAGSAIGRIKPEEALEIFLAFRDVAAFLSPEIENSLEKAINEVKASLAKLSERVA